MTTALSAAHEWDVAEIPWARSARLTLVFAAARGGQGAGAYPALPPHQATRQRTRLNAPADPKPSPCSPPEAEAPRPDQRRGYLDLLRRNVAFRRLFLARLASLGGDWFNTLAVLALLRELGLADASSFGGVLIAKMLPSLLVAPLAGVLVDRLDRKRLLVSMDLIRAAIVLTVLAMPAWAAWATAHDLPVAGFLYATVVLHAACIPISEPARNAVLPDLVDSEDLVAANALGAASWSLMFAIGVSLGGVVTELFGWRVAIGIDAATFFFSAFVLAGTAIPDHRQPGTGGHRGTFLEGLRFICSRPRILTLALAKAGWSLAGGITLLLTVLGERVYPVDGRPILAVSALWLARAFGTGAGPFAARALCGQDPRRAERILSVAFLWGGLCYIALGHMPWLWAAMLAVALAHLGGATVWVFSTVRLQALTPTAIRGRVFSAEQAVWTLVMATSTWILGLLIDQEVASLPQITTGLGYVLIIPGLAWLLRCAWLGDPPRYQASARGQGG